MENMTHDEMKIACCKTCLLADAMKTCNTCSFNIGLVYKGLDHVKKVDIDYPIELKQARLSNLKLSII